jgi:hypothetical protein
MFMFPHQTAGHIHNIKIVNKYFGFKYLEMTVTYQNYVTKNLRADSILGMLTAVHFGNFLSSCLISTIVKIKTTNKV